MSPPLVYPAQRHARESRLLGLGNSFSVLRIGLESGKLFRKTSVDVQIFSRKPVTMSGVETEVEAEVKNGLKWCRRRSLAVPVL